VSSWRAKDLCRIVAARFGVVYSENGMLRLLHDLDLSWQKARPIHPEADLKAQARFKKIPGADRRGRRDHPEAERLEVWFLDEARVGQTGRLCRRWYQKGMRPRGLRDLRHQAVYLFGAVCPERDAGVALVLPAVSAAAMQAMLDELGQAVSPEAHAVVLMDRASWHIAKDLAAPANLTPLFLPPYSPELNAIEQVWLLSARALPLAPSLAQLRRHPRGLLRRLERAARRDRPHPLPLRPRLGHNDRY